MPSSGVVKMFTALADYVVAVHGGDDELFNGLLNAAHESLTARGPITDPEAETLLLELLQRPLQVTPTPARVLRLSPHQPEIVTEMLLQLHASAQGCAAAGGGAEAPGVRGQGTCGCRSS